MKYFVTGDIHGYFSDLSKRIKTNNIQTGDCLIILGDAGFNFFENTKDVILKQRSNNLGITLFSIQGNHEIRPENIPTYKIKEWNGGEVWYEPEFPNLLFAKDGEVYNINGNKTLVIGGAYSVDKYYRAARYYMQSGLFLPYDILQKLFDLAEGKNTTQKDKETVDNFLISDKAVPTGCFGWWNDEQISEENKKKIEKTISSDNNFDVILSHTCPLRYEPTEVFLPGLNQDTVDKSMETWLNTIEDKINYKKWYAGHFHLEKNLKNGFEFLFHEVREIFLLN